MGAFEKILKKPDEQKAPPQDMPATPIPNAPSTQVGVSKPDKIIKPQQPTPEVPNAPSAQVQINRGPDKIGSTPPEAKQQLSMAQMYEKLNAANKPLTEEQLEEQRKKERRDKMFASIGDGISALSNLFFTTQYAPNMYEGNKSMSERMRVRYDRLKKEREGKEKEYNAGLMNAMKYDLDQAIRQEREKRATAKDARDNALFQLQLELQGHKISAAEADAKRKEIEAQYADDLNKAKVGTEQKRGEYYSKRGKYYGKGGGNGKPGEYPWYDKDGNLHYAHDFGAMRQNAIMHGTWNEGEESSTTTKTEDRKTSTVSSTTTKKQEQGHSKKPKKENPMGNNKKPNPMS